MFQDRSLLTLMATWFAADALRPPDCGKHCRSAGRAETPRICLATASANWLHTGEAENSLGFVEELDATRYGDMPHFTWEAVWGGEHLRSGWVNSEWKPNQFVFGTRLFGGCQWFFRMEGSGGAKVGLARRPLCGNAVLKWPRRLTGSKGWFIGLPREPATGFFWKMANRAPAEKIYDFQEHGSKYSTFHKLTASKSSTSPSQFLDTSRFGRCFRLARTERLCLE